MRLPRTLCLALVGLLLLAAIIAGCGSSSSSSSSGESSAAEGESSGDPVKVGILQIADIEVLDQTVAAFEAGMKKSLAPREVEFELKDAQEETSLIAAISREFATSEDDMFAVIGTPAVIALAKEETERPIIAIAMGDPVGSKVADSLAKPGTNVTGSIDFINPSEILPEIEAVTPAPKKLATIYDPSNENSVVWVKALQEAVAETPGLSLEEATIGSSEDINAAARSVAASAEAILIGPDAKVYSGMPAVIAAAEAEGDQLYVVGGEPAEGVLAAIGPNYPTLGTHTGELAAEVAEGADPATTAFVKPESVEWAVDQATVKKLGVKLPASAGAGE
ncbi:MAG: ABC transporter substrate-binding protein [Solirubrobacterales bacterium]